MQLHHMMRPSSLRRSRRIGRGGKRGTYSGRGIKGQHARAGAKFRPPERDILKRIPKLRGYRFPSFREKPTAVSVRAIERRFSPGDIVSPETLFAKGLVRRAHGRIPRVKIVGGGSKNQKFVFTHVSFSRAADAKRT